MGFLSTLGSTAGTFFGGPLGGTIGGLLGGGLEYSNANQAASSTNESNIHEAQVNRDFQANQAYANRDFQASQAQINRDFQASQTSTAYQRAVADMKSAGLNPMLAYSQGGANSAAGSVPSGSGVSGAQAQIQNPGLASAQQLQSGSQSSLNEASAVQAAASADLAKETARKTIQEVSNLKTSNEQTSAIIKNLGEEYQNLVKQGWNLTDVGNQLRASVRLMSDQSDQIGALMRLTDWDSKLREQQGKLTGFDVQGAQSMGNLGRSFKEAGPMLELILRALTRR